LTESRTCQASTLSEECQLLNEALFSQDNSIREAFLRLKEEHERAHHVRELARQIETQARQELKRIDAQIRKLCERAGGSKRIDRLADRLPNDNTPFAGLPSTVRHDDAGSSEVRATLLISRRGIVSPPSLTCLYRCFERDYISRNVKRRAWQQARQKACARSGVHAEHYCYAVTLLYIVNYTDWIMLGRRVRTEQLFVFVILAGYMHFLLLYIRTVDIGTVELFERGKLQFHNI
jgi:hypothetical protein